MTVSATIGKEFAASLVKAQGEIEGAKKGKENTFFKDGKGKASKYADLASCWEACRDALQANQIAVLQFPSAAPPGHVGITGVLVYGPTGETLSETFNVPVKDATNPQAMGSAITYGRRYQLCSMIGICPDDDDGNAAASSGKAPPAQKQQQVDTESIKAQFADLKNKDDMKTFYSKVKAMVIPEPAKTALLTSMATSIKESK